MDLRCADSVCLYSMDLVSGWNLKHCTNKHHWHGSISPVQRWSQSQSGFQPEQDLESEFWKKNRPRAAVKLSVFTGARW